MGDKLELTMRDARTAHDGLQRLVEQYKADLPVAAALRVARILRQLRAEVELCQVQENDLILKHGETNDQGAIEVKLASQAGMAFTKDRLELLAQPCNLPIEPLALDELGLERVDADLVALILPVLAET